MMDTTIPVVPVEQKTELANATEDSSQITDWRWQMRHRITSSEECR